MQSANAHKGLIVGIGNPYRRDDGLGIELAGRVALPGFDVVSTMGIGFDMAETLCAYDIVIFMDASVCGDAVEFKQIYPDQATTLPLMHHISCEGILALTQALYQKYPKAYLLSVRGEDFEHGEGFSDTAQKNMLLALEIMQRFRDTLV